MRHTFTWTVAIALAAAGCGSDSSSTDSSSGDTDAVAGNTSLAGQRAIGGAVQTGIGGSTFSAAGNNNAAAGQPDTTIGAAGTGQLVGGASSIGVGGATASTDAGASSTGGVVSTGVGGTTVTTTVATNTSAPSLGGASTSGGTVGVAGTYGTGGLVATGGTSAVAAGSCAVTYYRDADGDTWGTGDPSCTGGAGWVTRTGDCNDANADVFPEQTTTFAVSYVATNGTQSFDYNCDGAETIAGGTQVSSGTCETAGLGNACSGDGYLPAEPARTGTNLNQLCGSMRYLVCARSQQTCIGAVSSDGSYQAARCK